MSMNAEERKNLKRYWKRKALLTLGIPIVFGLAGWSAIGLTEQYLQYQALKQYRELHSKFIDKLKNVSPSQVQPSITDNNYFSLSSDDYRNSERNFATKVLTVLGDKTTIPAFQSQVESPDIYVRFSSILALRELGDSQPMIDILKNEPDIDVRISFATWLSSQVQNEVPGRNCNLSEIKALNDALRDSHQEMKYQVSHILVRYHNLCVRNEGSLEDSTLHDLIKKRVLIDSQFAKGFIFEVSIDRPITDNLLAKNIEILSSIAKNSPDESSKIVAALQLLIMNHPLGESTLRDIFLNSKIRQNQLKSAIYLDVYKRDQSKLSLLFGLSEIGSGGSIKGPSLYFSNVRTLPKLLSMPKTKILNKNEDLKIRQIASEFYQQSIKRNQAWQKEFDEDRAWQHYQLQNQAINNSQMTDKELAVCFKDKSDIPHITFRLIHHYVKNLLPSYQEYVGLVFGADKCLPQYEYFNQTINRIAEVGQKDAIPWLKLLAYLPYQSYNYKSQPVIQSTAAKALLQMNEPSAALPYLINELGTDYSGDPSRGYPVGSGRLLDAAYSIRKLNQESLLTDNSARLKESSFYGNLLIFSTLSLGVLLMTIVFLRLRSPFPIFYSTYLLFPEEVVAELIALKQRRQDDNVKPWKIKLELAYEILTLIWTFQIQIRIDDLKLPPGGNRSAK